MQERCACNVGNGRSEMLATAKNIEKSDDLVVLDRLATLKIRRTLNSTRNTRLLQTILSDLHTKNTRNCAGIVGYL